MISCEFIGDFWLPCKEKEQVCGRLKIDEENRITLTIYDNFDSEYSSPDYLNNLEEYCKRDVILGFLENGKEVAILSTRKDGYKLFPKISIRFLAFSLLYVDLRDQVDYATLLYNKASFCITSIHQLLGYNILDFKKDYKKEISVSVKTVQPEPKKFKIAQDVVMSIVHTYRYNEEAHLKAKFENLTKLELEFGHGKTGNEIAEDYIRTIAIFFSMLRGKYLNPYDIELISFNETQRSRISHNAHFSLFAPSDDEKNPYIDDIRYFIELDDFGKIVKNFVCLYNNNPELFNIIYYGSFKNPPVLDYSFLSFYGAIDSLLMDIEDNRYITDMEYKSSVLKPYKDFVEKLDIKNCPDGFKEWLKKALEHGNIQSFRDRFISFAKNNQDILPARISEDPSCIANQLNKYRNELAHIRKRKRDKHEYYIGLINLWPITRCILDTLILRKIGCNKDSISTCIASKYRHQIQ